MSALENLISIVSSITDNTVLRHLKISSENFLMKLKFNTSFDRASSFQRLAMRSIYHPYFLVIQCTSRNYHTAYREGYFCTDVDFLDKLAGLHPFKIIYIVME